jgi:hypothetical protein
MLDQDAEQKPKPQQKSVAAEVLPVLAVIVGVPLFLWIHERRQKRRPRRNLGRQPRQWWRQRPPAQDRVCYRTKTDALTAFLDTNYQIVENYGGPSYRVGPSEFDAINHKYSLRGKKAARTIAEAVWAAMPAGRPFCLDEIDLDALNDTSPAREAGMNFRLPDYVFEAQAAAEEERFYRELYEQEAA